MPKGIVISVKTAGVNHDERSNETYLHGVNDDEEEETADDVAKQNYDEMEPDKMYETMNTDIIYESKEAIEIDKGEESAEDTFENDEGEESAGDTFENDEHEESVEDTFENDKHAEDEANNNGTFEFFDEQKNNATQVLGDMDN